METNFYQHSASLPQTHMHRSTACAVTLDYFAGNTSTAGLCNATLNYYFFKDEGKKERKKVASDRLAAHPSKTIIYSYVRPRLSCHR